MPKKKSLFQDMYVTVLDYASGSSNYTWILSGWEVTGGNVKNSMVSGLLIKNDSLTSSLTFQVNGLTMTLLPEEKFEGRFDLFNKVIITATDSWRLWITA